MLKIGVTGGIGVGKSVVCRIFALLGIPIYDADTRAKWVMRHDEALKQELTDAFGTGSYTEDGELNRAYLAKTAFHDPQKLALLNSIVHPHVAKDFSDWVAANNSAPYIVKEAALMYESEAWRQMDEIIAVFAPMDVRIKRLLQRDTHRTQQDIEAIIGKQLQEEEKMARAQHIVYNDDKQLLIPQVLKLHEAFLSKV
ncbi:dephospho-CoA kinase [Pontibacter populi]|uniref:Dephospho-CoA kinase n=1 Tax=Pontibacter populi TaxID=890055 RepID=A0ABV1RSJ0_9BACT